MPLAKGGRLFRRASLAVFRNRLNVASPRAMERRMAALFALALALILWQAWRTKPAPVVSFTMVTEPGEQVLPFAVPSWREALAAPGARDERLGFLEGRAVVAPAGQGASPCRLFLRVSAHHWLQHPASRPAPGEGHVFFLPPEALLDDDDGDGDFLDPGELTRNGPGAEAEVFCA